jgi:hypothetical protein
MRLDHRKAAEHLCRSVRLIAAWPSRPSELTDGLYPEAVPAHVAGGSKRCFAGGSSCAKRTFAYAHLSALPIRQANEAVGARLAAVTAKRESGGVATAVGESAIA